MKTTKHPPKTTFTSAVSSLFSPLSFFSDNLIKYPEIFSSRLLNFSAFVINKPEYVEHVLTHNQKNYYKGEKYGILRYLAGKGLVTNDGESWLRQRRMIQPYFYHQNLSNMVAVMADETQSMIQRHFCENKLNVSKEMGKLTISIVGKAMFGTDAEGKIDAIRTEMDIYQKIGNILLRIPFQLPENTPEFPLLIRMKRAIQRLDKIVMDIIKKRRINQERKGDLLDLLMDAQDEDSSDRMSDKQLRDEVLTIFLAGHETTLLALSWTFYLLAHHPEVRNKAFKEVKKVWKKDQPFTLERYKELSYLENVINESMRLYPPAYIITRKALAEDYIGDYYVPAKKDVFINVYGIHRHLKYWKDPNSFIPERFETFSLKGMNKYLFLPFGGGPRYCLGSTFSMLEMKIVIASVLRIFDFTPEDERPIKPNPLITLKPEKDIIINLKKRTN